MNERILIIDDDELVRTGLTTAIEQAGYPTLAAASGEEALQLLNTHPIDLLLCDLLIGDTHGIHLLKTIREEGFDIPALVITGYGSLPSAVEALRLGARDYLQKPIRPEEVLHRIELVLEPIRLMKRWDAERERTGHQRERLTSRWVESERMAAIGRVTASAALDLGQNLESLHRATRALLDALPAGGGPRDLASEIRESSERALAVARDLELLGESDRAVLQEENLNTVIESYLASPEFRGMQQAYPGVRLATRMDPSLPPMTGNRRLLQEALDRLLKHLFASAATDRELVLSTTYQPPENGRSEAQVVLSVLGGNAEMEPSAMETWYEPLGEKQKAFGPADSLAMAVMHKIVTDQQGRIRISNTGGQGVQIAWMFPVKVSPDKAKPKQSPNDPWKGEESVLVVDDYEEARAIASTILESLGYSAETAMSGHEAVAKTRERIAAGKGAFDLVLLDMILGDNFDGLDTYEALLRIHPEQRAVIVSGFAETDRMIKARRLGAGDFVQKPFTIETLGRAIRKTLDRPPPAPPKT